MREWYGEREKMKGWKLDNEGERGRMKEKKRVSKVRWYEGRWNEKRSENKRRGREGKKRMRWEELKRIERSIKIMQGTKWDKREKNVRKRDDKDGKGTHCQNKKNKTSLKVNLTFSHF